MALSNLVREHQETIRLIIANHHGFNPKEMGNHPELEHDPSTVKIFVELSPSAGWANLVAIESELSELLSARVSIYANLTMVPQYIMQQACPI